MVLWCLTFVKYIVTGNSINDRSHIDMHPTQPFGRGTTNVRKAAGGRPSRGRVRWVLLIMRFKKCFNI